MIKPILQVRKLSPRDIEQLVQGHTGHRCFFSPDNQTYTEIASGEQILVLCRQLIFESAFPGQGRLHGPKHLLPLPKLGMDQLAPFSLCGIRKCPENTDILYYQRSQSWNGTPPNPN